MRVGGEKGKEIGDGKRKEKGVKWREERRKENMMTENG